jgi:Holliday junction resolvase RusA-like endonuclease
MRFFAGSSQAPALHNLVKFYLDLMSSIVFSDDRQVGYLVAQCWRPPRRYADSDRAEGSVFIEVERLTDYKRRFDLFFALLKLDEFHDHIKWNRRYRHLVDEDDLFHEIGSLWLKDAVADWLGVPVGTGKAIRRLATIERQKRLLMINRLDQYDRPGGPQGKYLRKERMELRDLLPMTINLGGLPARGKSGQYKRRIREKLKSLKKQFQLFTHILVPVELDVQVTPRALRLGKDLDNIMRDIAPIFAEEFFDQETYMHGYRIYTINKASDDDMPSSIRLKLLPPGAINDFEDTMEEIFEIGKEWLEDQLRWW